MEYLRALERIESVSAKREPPTRNNLLTIELAMAVGWNVARAEWGIRGGLDEKLDNHCGLDGYGS
ncbi:MAG: hypothetical protein HC852_20505 [Acaryochloridaceae cyanobacterium RU_4_10]|nr:hypothetical protein [Acaryochloridaceae cyanobacterium RU_4_10]